MIGEITQDWADGTYTFLLRRKQWLELQAKYNMGPIKLYMLVMNDEWGLELKTDIVRLGLIGGGTPPTTALRLARAYDEDQPIMENVKLIKGIVQTRFFVTEGDGDPKKGEPQAETTGLSTPPETTAPQPS